MTDLESELQAWLDTRPAPTPKPSTNVDNFSDLLTQLDPTGETE